MRRHDSASAKNKSFDGIDIWFDLLNQPPNCAAILIRSGSGLGQREGGEAGYPGANVDGWVGRPASVLPLVRLQPETPALVGAVLVIVVGFKR